MEHSISKKSRKNKVEFVFTTIRELVDRAGTEYGDTVGYRWQNGNGEIVDVTYAEFKDTVDSLGSVLTKLGFGRSHIACIGENRYDWIVAYLTALESAGIFLPIDKELPSSEVLHLLTEGDAEVLFFSAKYEDKIRAILPSLGRIKLFIGFDLEEDNDFAVSYKKLIERGKNIPRNQWEILCNDENELKMLVYTSGTTGIAKGVMLSEHNLVSGIYYGVQVSQIYDTALSVLPYHHTYESVCDILVNIYFHSTLCINQNLRNLLKDMQLYHPTNVYIVPAIAEFIYSNLMHGLKKNGKAEKLEKGIRLSNRLRKIGIDIRPKLFSELHNLFGGRLKKIVCGGAPIRPDVGKFFDSVGIAMTGGYGITECSPLVSVNDESDNHFNTAGHRLACLEWRIDEPNEEGIGEIIVKGDVVMLGYYKNPTATDEALEDGWFRTGDYGYITADDQVVITGRKKNIIVLDNGKNIYPEELENKIAVLDEINEVVVRPLKNERGDDHSLYAEIYSETETDANVLLHSINELLSELPAYKKMAKVVLRSEPFPKTTTNKIKRNQQ